jgi:hypothetical protein
MNPKVKMMKGIIGVQRISPRVSHPKLQALQGKQMTWLIARQELEKSSPTVEQRTAAIMKLKSWSI